MSSGRLIEERRRRPEHCLYCMSPATSPEHIVPQALGGRLTANILCGQHNNEIGARTDKNLIDALRPLLNYLHLKRQDGRLGADYVGKSKDGEPVRVSAGGRIKVPLDVQRNERKRIVSGTGDLNKMDALRDYGALEDADQHSIIAMVVKPPIVYAGVSSDAGSESAVLKIALHFVAAFVRDIEIDTARTLLPYVLGDLPANPEYVRAAPFNRSVFPKSWPPHHQVTCWAEGDVMYVGVLLFDGHPYLCRIPIPMGNVSTLCYRQPLLAEPAPLLFENIPVEPAAWDIEFDPDGFAEWAREINRRLTRIRDYGQEREIREQCMRAANEAERIVSGGGDYWEWYRARLQMELLSADEIDARIRVGRILRAQGREVWEFPIRKE